MRRLSGAVPARALLLELYGDEWLVLPAMHYRWNVEETVGQIAAWATSDPARRELPRTLGTHHYVVDRVDEQRAIYPYSIWMWQRCDEHVRGLAEAERALLAPLLAALPGAAAAFSSPIPRRVLRRDNRLELA